MNDVSLHAFQPPLSSNQVMNFADANDSSSDLNNETFTLASIDCGAWTPLRDMLDLMEVLIDIDLHAKIVQPTVRQLQGGQHLFLENAPVKFINVVRTGVFKVFRTSEGGYEQISGFMRRGDLLGFDGLLNGRHRTAAAALQEASVFSIALPDFYAFAQEFPSFDRGVMRAMAKAMVEMTKISEMIAAPKAEVRLARFLLHVSGCMEGRGQSPKSLHLEMTRREIGSYLGVAHETISRSFSVLTEAGIIEVEQRNVEIADLGALQRYARAGATTHSVRQDPN